MHQGITIDCFYCTKLRANNRDPNCKICEGKITYFRPARMMDRYTSDLEIIKSIVEFSKLFEDREIIIEDFFQNPKAYPQLISKIELLYENSIIYSTNIEDIFERILIENSTK